MQNRRNLKIYNTMVASGYARTYQAQSVLTASPGQLVLMLYDGALKFLNIFFGNGGGGHQLVW